MTAFLIIAHCTFGNIMLPLDPDSIAALQQRGISTNIADVSAAIDRAFAARDKELVIVLAEYLTFSNDTERLADQVIRLYEGLPEDDFKESITVPIAVGLNLANHVIQSKWACHFYRSALKLLDGPAGTEGRNRAVQFFEVLSSQCGLDIGPYLVRAVLLSHDNIVSAGKVLLDCWPFVTPAMAYQILKCYAPQHGETQNEALWGPYRERAKPLLEAKQLPPGASREAVLKQLDAMIEAEGKKLCDKYGKMEYKPAPSRGPNVVE